MKGFKMNVYKAGIAFAVLVSILGICAFCYEREEEADNVKLKFSDFVATTDIQNDNKAEQYRDFIKSELEAMIEAQSAISDCNIDFEVSDVEIVKVKVMLEFTVSYEDDREKVMENIQKAVAAATALAEEDVSVSE